MILVLSIVACTNQTELEKVSIENEALSFKVDSLQNLLNSYTVVTVLDNNVFSVKVGEVYSVESMAVLKNGLVLDSLIINDTHFTDNDSALTIEQGFFGPVINFMSKKQATMKLKHGFHLLRGATSQ